MAAAVQTSILDVLKSAQNTDDGSLNMQPVTAATGTASNVSGSASSVTLLAANASRVGAMIFNDAANVLYVKLGATASTTSYTVQLAASAYYELPSSPIYTGVIDGIWSASGGAARVTELT